MANFLTEFRDILAKGDDLPTLPGVVRELQAALDDEFVSGGRIASIINRDPPMATRLLRLANSAAFNCGTAVGEVNTAIQLLGFRQVRALCIALAVVNAFSHRRDGLIHGSFWQHSAGVAFAARELARCLGYSEIPLEQLYMGGLLHDVGLLLMDQHFPTRLEDSLDVAQACDEPLWRAESILLGTDHAEIGSLLLGSWSLPPAIVSMVASHHNPRLAPEKYRDACWLIFAAEIICGGLAPSLPIERLTRARAVSILDTMRAADYDVDALLMELWVATEEFAPV